MTFVWLFTMLNSLQKLFNFKMSISLSSLLSSDNRRSNDIKKINEKGEYLLFEGLTVVMPLQTDLSAMYEELQTIVPKEVHALLPKESYHVTVTGIRCRFHFKTCEKYNEFLEQNIMAFERLKKSFEHGSGNFMLEHEVGTDMSQITAHLKPADTASAQYLDTMAAHCEKHLGKFYRKSRSHLSLAYKIPSSKDLTLSECTNIAATLNKHLQGTVLTFGEPTICKFSNMCSYTAI
jgi:hypothetical protein